MLVRLRSLWVYLMVLLFWRLVVYLIAAWHGCIMPQSMRAYYRYFSDYRNASKAHQNA